MLQLRAVRATAAFASVAAVTLAQLNLPSELFWNEQQGWLYSAVGTLAAIASYDAVKSIGDAIQLDKIRKYDRELRAALSTGVLQTVNAFSLPWDEIAVYRYEPRGYWRWRKLHRVSAVRAGAAPALRGERWRVGAGIVGTAFAEEVVVADEWRLFVAAAMAQTPSGWAARPAAARYNLSWGELMRAERYDGIVASPTFGINGKPDGCIAICGPLKMSDLVSAEMQAILARLAGQMDLIGPAPRGWWSSID